MKQLTVGLSTHRPELLPLISGSMKNHDAIFLEEPPTARFREMLNEVLAIDEYVVSLEAEYPEFTRRMCQLSRELNRSVKKIYQVEPFLEYLIEIHTFFAQGHGPQDLNRESDHYPVYLAERKATGALLNFYKTVLTESFDATIDAVLRFAKLDAARFRLRDSLRAQALTPLIRRFESSYIEAGEIHYILLSMLRQNMPNYFQVKPFFIATAALNKLGINGHLYSPGDRLTLLYVFHPTFQGTAREKILAARSLIYTKLIEKVELTDDVESFPHLRNEFACIQTVDRLLLEDCRNLFPDLRRTKTSAARKVVDEYLLKYSG
jgi:hypothetical protein